MNKTVVVIIVAMVVTSALALKKGPGYRKARHDGAEAYLKVCLVDNEGNGVSEAILQRAAKTYIPMYGQAESLNVGVSAAVVLYEAVRQRIAAGIDHVPAYVPWHGEGTHDH